MSDASKGLVALAGCRISRPAAFAGGVELVEAEPAPRGFAARVTESLGVCLKLGAAHGVRSDGRSLSYPADALCVRFPGCVWSSDVASVGFVSVDVSPALLPPDVVGRPMQFARADAVPVAALLPALESARSPLAQGEALAALVEALFRAGLLRAGSLREVPSSPRAVERARDYLHADLGRSPSLDELAEATGTNRFVLLRHFKKQLGMGPHGYLIRLRVERSRQMLARGEAPADVASTLGFADQGHLGRHFRRVMGITPGEYAQRARRARAPKL